MKFFISLFCLLLISSCIEKKVPLPHQCHIKVDKKYIPCLTDGRHTREECREFRDRGHLNCSAEYSHEIKMPGYEPRYEGDY
jgi:hypothetical protein